MNNRIKLRVQGLTNSQVQSGAYALVLAEENGPRRVPIIVGTAEAQSIAIALEQIIPPRPLTHDLFAKLIQATNAILLEVFIYKFEEGIFYSELNLETGGKLIKIDSRTSDAIAIALRVNCEIYTTEAIVRECGVVLDEESDTFDDTLDDEADEQFDPEDIKDEKKLKEWLATMPLEELQKRLNESIASENYEFAKLYRDEQDRREQKEK